MDRPSSPTDRQRGKRPWVVVAIIASVGIAILGLRSSGCLKSADERLAEIEAARAIPEAENAAIIYDELLRDPRAMSLWNSRPNTMTDPNFSGVFAKPWRAVDYPEVAAWIAEHQYLIDTLAEASKLEKCRFPIHIDSTDSSATSRDIGMIQWEFLLRFAANNDLAEGRFDQAVATWRSLLQMANHLRQQPLLNGHVLANNITKSTSESIAWFIMEGNPTEAHLQHIEAIPLPSVKPWRQYLDEILTVEDLRARKARESWGLWDRIRYPLHSYRARRGMRQMYGKELDSTAEWTRYAYRENLAITRGMRILVAMRRHKNVTGHWPASLDQIEPALPPEILVDPLGDSLFIYTPSGDTFTLRFPSVGGLYKGDDLSIWPLSQK